MGRLTLTRNLRSRPANAAGLDGEIDVDQESSIEIQQQAEDFMHAGGQRIEIWFLAIQYQAERRGRNTEKRRLFCSSDSTRMPDIVAQVSA